MSCQLNFIKLAQSFLANSGRSYLHLGHYNECIENPKMKFLVMNVGQGETETGIFFTSCVPRVCTDDYISQKMQSALKIVGLSPPYYISSVDSNTQNYEYPMNWLSYLTAFILTVILLLVITATIKGYKNNRKNKWLQSFNFASNMKIFKVREGQDLNVLDGIRALAMMWVVFGHVFSFSINSTINVINTPEIASHAFYLLVEAGIMAVDVFFCLGGFFLAFIMLRNKINLKICGLGILQRALRIWPAYILAMLFYYTLYMRLGSGPLWNRQEKAVQNCSTMWKQVIFLQNFILLGKDGSTCLGWGWYLQVDFQLFICGVFLLYLYKWSKKSCLATILALSILSSVYVFVVTMIYKMKMYTDIAQLGDTTNWMIMIYVKPYGRCVPYLMGLALGIFYMEYKKSVKQNASSQHTFLSKVRNSFRRNNIKRIAFEWVGIGLMAFVTFIPRSIQTGYIWPQWLQSLYIVFSKPIFILGMIMTVLPSCLGIAHSFFNLILNAKIFTWIARISFCTYLVHLMVIFRNLSMKVYDIEFNNTYAIVTHFGLLVLSLFFGFIATMTIEVPFANMLKLAFMGLKEKEKSQKTVKKGESVLTSESVHEELIKNDK